MFTNINNIFWVCVDNLKKLSYNVKRMLSQARRFVAEMPKILLFVLLFIMAMILSAFNIGSDELPECGGATVSLKLEIVEIGSDHFSVALRYDGADELCGVLTDITYDEGLLTLDGVMAGRDLSSGGALTYISGDGRIAVLLDSPETLSVGELAVIRFFRNEPDGEIGMITLSGGCGNACLLRNGRIEKACLSGNTLISGKDDSFSAGAVSLDVSFSGGELSVCCISGEESQFLGARLTVTDIYGMTTETYTVSARSEVSADGAFSSTAVLTDACGDRCVIVVSLLRYCRDRVETGEERVLLLYDGKMMPVSDS